METFGERISKLIDTFTGGNKTLFANKIGTSEANIRHYINGKMPKPQIIESIAMVFGINYEWLLSGIGEMKSDNKNQDILMLEKNTLERLVIAQQKLIDVLEKRVEELENRGTINKSAI